MTPLRGQRRWNPRNKAGDLPFVVSGIQIKETPMALGGQVAVGVINEDKHEAPNPKQIQNPNVSNATPWVGSAAAGQTDARSVGRQSFCHQYLGIFEANRLEFGAFEFVSDFVLRAFPANLKAVSAVMPRVPRTIPLMRRGGTFNARASAF